MQYFLFCCLLSGIQVDVGIFEIHTINLFDLRQMKREEEARGHLPPLYLPHSASLPPPILRSDQIGPN